MTELPSFDYACQYAKDRLTGKITCMVCGEEGHYTCDCSMKIQEEKVICTLCNRVGHCHLWCCRQNVSENHACRRCGEKGHYTKKKLSCCGQKCGHNKDISCSSCDTNHLLGKCPMGGITCFICESKNHVPAQCRLSPLLTAVTKYHRESFYAALKKAKAETSKTTLAPVKPSAESSHDEEVPNVSNFSSGWHGHSERKNTIRSEVPENDETSHATMRDTTLALLPKSTCLNCLGECHSADRCPIKKPSRELEPHDVTDGKKKLSKEMELCDITCFKCHDKGHKSYSCPQKSPGELEQSDVTCLKCHCKGHYTYSCPNKKPHRELELYDDSHECQSKEGSEMVPNVSRLSHFAEDHCDMKSPISQAPNSDETNHAAMRDKAVTLVSKNTCFNCHEEGHYVNKCTRKKPPKELELHDATHINFHVNSCPKKKAPGELEVSDVTCFKCHDKGHKSNSCPKKKSPGELEQSDFTCFRCHEKGHKSYSCPKKKSPEELELSDVTCFSCHDKGHKSYSCPKKKPLRGLELSDTCFRCHNQGHYMHNCHKKKPRR